MLEQKPGKGKTSPDLITLIGNILLTLGAAIGLFVLAKTYLFTGNLPTGACPLTLNRPWLYTSIALLLLSLVISFFEPRKPKDKVK